MPQMAPYNWINLYLMFLLILIYLIILIYFYKSSKINYNLNSLKIYYNWKW